MGHPKNLESQYSCDRRQSVGINFSLVTISLRIVGSPQSVVSLLHKATELCPLVETD